MIYTPEVSSAEYRVYHKLMRYAGTCDMICSINDIPTLVDYKTTATVSDMTCAIQLEAYLQALKQAGQNQRWPVLIPIAQDHSLKSEWSCIKGGFVYENMGSLNCFLISGYYSHASIM